MPPKKNLEKCPHLIRNSVNKKPYTFSPGKVEGEQELGIGHWTLFFKVLK